MSELRPTTEWRIEELWRCGAFILFRDDEVFMELEAPADGDLIEGLRELVSLAARSPELQALIHAAMTKGVSPTELYSAAMRYRRAELDHESTA